ncbi:MAG: hypothetical protein AB1757_16295 [Acidobacteriota bacterium]
MNLTVRFKRALAQPAPRKNITVDMSVLNSAAEVDTQDIRDEIPRVESMNDVQARDREYQQLATKAAYKADARLAEELMAKITDDEIRKETTLKVYSPLVRKAMDDKNWLLARAYAFKVSDPLGRTLILDTLMQRMAKAGEEKNRIREIYVATLNQLASDEPTDKVAKAFLLIARGQLAIDAELKREAINSAVSVLNGLAKKDEKFAESSIGGVIGTWIRYPEYSYRPDEVLALTDMTAQVFKELAKENPDTAYEISVGITHTGLRALSHLAISKGLMETLAMQPPARQPKKG